MSEYIALPAPNTQPIYPRVPLDWRANLTNQVTPYDVNGPSLTKPVLIGEASGSGAIIEAMSIVSLIPLGSGNGTYGLIIAGVPVEFRFYSQRLGDTRYWFEGTINASDATRVTTPDNAFPAYYPILPNPQRAWRLGPNERFYVGVSAAIAAPGCNIFVRGGQYA